MILSDSHLGSGLWGTLLSPVIRVDLALTFSYFALNFALNLPLILADPPALNFSNLPELILADLGDLPVPILWFHLIFDPKEFPYLQSQSVIQFLLVINDDVSGFTRSTLSWKSWMRIDWLKAIDSGWTAVCFMMIPNAFRRTLLLASPLFLSLIGSMCALLCEISHLIFMAIASLIFIQQLRQQVQ